MVLASKSVTQAPTEASLGDYRNVSANAGRAGAQTRPATITYFLEYRLGGKWIDWDTYERADQAIADRILAEAQNPGTPFRTGHRWGR